MQPNVTSADRYAEAAAVARAAAIGLWAVDSRDYTDARPGQAGTVCR